jgi:hypothetical protein
VLAQVPRELREIADALETRAPVSPMPAIPRPPHPPRVVAARGPGAQIRQRDPLLSRLVFELTQCIFSRAALLLSRFAPGRCAAIQ